MIMNYRHIIWDWNGTLLDDRRICVKSINQVLQKRKLDLITLDDYMHLFMFPVKKFYEKLGFNFTYDSFNDAGDEFIDYYNDNFQLLKLHKNTVTILDYVKSLGKTQSILSAAMEKMLQDWVLDHGLTLFFNKVIGVDNQYAHGKIDIGKQYVESLKFDRKEILMIGDTPHDSEVAEAMEIDCILVEHGHVNELRLKKTGRKTFPNFAELLKFI